MALKDKKMVRDSVHCFAEEDVAEAIKEFETWLQANYGINEEYKKSIMWKKYKEIFGDFDK